jgi:hypothetical protein
MSVALREELDANLSAVLWVLLACSLSSEEASEDGGVFCVGASGIYNAPL